MKTNKNRSKVIMVRYYHTDVLTSELAEKYHIYAKCYDLSFKDCSDGMVYVTIFKSKEDLNLFKILFPGKEYDDDIYTSQTLKEFLDENFLYDPCVIKDLIL